MITLSFIEHLQKVPYLLSIFFPVIFFFLFGLLLAWWFWSKYLKELRGALKKNENLNASIAELTEQDQKLTSRFSSLYKSSQKEWQAKLDADKDQLEVVSKRLNDAESERTGLLSELSEKGGQQDQLNAELERIKEEKEKAQNSKSSEQERLSKELEALKAQMAEKEKQLQLQLEEKDSQIANLQGVKADLSSQLNQKEGELTEQLTAVGLLSAKVKDAESKGIDETALDSLKGQLESERNGHEQTKERLLLIEGKLSETETALEEEKKKADQSPTPATFFANTSASANERHGYLFDTRPDHVDRLTEIKGVGEVLEPKLNDFGVYQYKQIALWSQENIDAFSEDLDFPGRVEREQWVNQAADLHRKYHGEHLAPVIDIYHPAKPQVIVKEVMREFEGEDVEEDEKLGILYKSRPDTVDDLKKIKGVADVLEKKLNEFGIYRFKQIVNWSPENIAEFTEQLSFPDRIERDEWQRQAAALHVEEYGI